MAGLSPQTYYTYLITDNIMYSLYICGSKKYFRLGGKLENVKKRTVRGWKVIKTKEMMKDGGWGETCKLKKGAHSPKEENVLYQIHCSIQKHSSISLL